GDDALNVLYELHPEFKTRIVYERTKFNALLGNRQAHTTGLDEGFTNEREVFVSKGKAVNPPAAGLVNKRHTAIKEYDQQFPDLYKKVEAGGTAVLRSAVNKQFAELAPYEFDAIAKYAEDLGLQPVL